MSARSPETARYAVEHVMDFAYESPVRLSVMTLYLCPLRDRRQWVRSFSVRTDPAGALFDFTDSFGNAGHFLDRPTPHRRMVVRARSQVELAPTSPLPDRLAPGAWEAVRRASRDPRLWALTHASRFVQPDSPLLRKFVSANGLEPSDDPLTTALALRNRLHRTFEYAPGATAVDSPIERILETGQGVCQDYAHVMASILRGWGLPCRYVSGYLGPDPEAEEGAASRPEAEGESHAWVECWFPELGWTGFDPTNDSGDDRHVRVAVGRDYADVPPSRGVYKGAAGSVLETTVVVTRVDGA